VSQSEREGGKETEGKRQRGETKVKKQRGRGMRGRDRVEETVEIA
jgi:hypothetical protein